MKSLISLWSIMAGEMAIRCCTSATRDVKTITGRTEHEGLSFLAITLADLGKATQKWLDQGFVVPADCPAFHTGRNGRLPRFLSGFFERVFDPCSGVLLESPDIEAIYALRQLTLVFGKIALPDAPRKGRHSSGNRRQVVSRRREKRAMSEFIQTEQDVRSADSILDPLHLEDFRRISAMLFGDLFSKVDRDIHWGRIYPKHGPGATADHLKANAKWNQESWTERMERVFPPQSYLASSETNFRQREQGLNILKPGAEEPVRVISVPKTLKAPRVIAIEPTCMQYMQQGILGSILNALKEDGFLSRIIGIDNQVPNQELARSGSFSGELATLDLSEASDRVSNQHVLAMLSDWPLLSEAVQATRSRKADVPGYGVIRLAKFASMGSALCFPFEAMVFMTLVFLGIEREHSAPFSSEAELHRFRKQVRVFGDDIICPREYVLSVVDTLENFGFRVNVSKSFWTGRFRESCGKEYYDGEDVGIVRVRKVLPTQRQDADGVISAVALRNHLYRGGLWQAARWMDTYLRDLIRVFPNVTSSSPLLGRESFLGYEYRRLDPYLFSPLTKGYVKKARSPESHLEGTGALLKCLREMPFSERGIPSPVTRPPLVIDAVSVDDEHLERSGRPERVNIKLGWARPF
jgi:hypothetical protein